MDTKLFFKKSERQKPEKRPKVRTQKRVYGLELFVLCAVIAVMAVPSSESTPWWSIVKVALAIAALVFTVTYYSGTRRKQLLLLKQISTALDPTGRHMLRSFPLPVMVEDSEGYIAWYNDRFDSEVAAGMGLCGHLLYKAMPELSDADEDSGVVDVRYGDRRYAVSTSAVTVGGRPHRIHYFFDETALKEKCDEYDLSRPSVLIITLDNFEVLMENEKESDRIRTTAKIETIIDDFMRGTTGVLIRQRRDRFLAIMEERHMRQVVEGRFQLLSEARSCHNSDQVPITMSIGVGRMGATLSECEAMAKQALDMAQGRGGDQAAIKTAAGFEFFGGMSQSQERRTKVKTRIVAAALLELIEASSNILIMGHRASDLDALGASFGIASAALKLGKKVKIVIDRQTTLAGTLYERIAQSDEGVGLFVSPRDAEEYVEKDTLLMVMDTHTRALAEDRELLDICKTVVVVDHHRKVVGHIDNAVIFYHEPYASSASEMVTELVQYFGDKAAMSRLSAEALLSGIMLDTKNFVMKTGVRTFEAAAYLRRRGADTVEVRKLFLNSIDAYRERTHLVASAKIYKGCAVAVSKEKISEIQIVAPQAADELLGLEGVDASFVVYDLNGTVYVSARSMGAFNVQLIMESLGGGGHHTMAGAQLPGADPDEVGAEILRLIEQYISEQQ